MSHQNLWAPWRMEYLRQLDSSTPPAPGGPPGCFLCDAGQTEPGSALAKERFVIARDSRGVILLNRFPYTNGHLLVSLASHVGDLIDLTAEQRNGVFELTTLAEELLRAAIHPQGINIGINLGRCAGAGVPGHLHVHVVPRWAGDVNFMQTVGQVRVIPQALEESFEHLSEVWSKMSSNDRAGAQ